MITPSQLQPESVKHERGWGRSGSIIIIGPYPPPVHGFAQATLDIADWLQSSGFDVIRIDLKPIHKEKGVLSSLELRLKQIGGCWKGAKNGLPVYLALSGGNRQFVDLLFLGAARLAGARILIHHHTFSYLDQPTTLSRLCIAIAGKHATHLALCGKMRELLQQKYMSAAKVEIISNAGLESVSQAWKPRTAVRNIGYLSSVTREKGILTFLEVAELMIAKYPKLRFLIAGPCSDDSVRATVLESCNKHKQISYLGPVYGDDKRTYLESLDAVLFPTTYRNEAEPLVIWEAISAGIPVIAWDLGCIGEMLLSNLEPELAAIPKGASFVESAVRRLGAWVSSPESFQQASIKMKNQFDLVANRSAANLKRIFAQVSQTEAEGSET